MSNASNSYKIPPTHCHVLELLEVILTDNFIFSFLSGSCISYGHACWGGKLLNIHEFLFAEDILIFEKIEQ